MSKAEKFIQEYTRNCSNDWYDDLSHGYEPWLTPDQALRAVEIAREETINDMCDWIVSGLDVNEDGMLTVNVKEFVQDLKNAMKDE